MSAADVLLKPEEYVMGHLFLGSTKSVDPFRTDGGLR
jgi:hypothetical protein